MNYLGFLSILSIIGLIGFIRRDSAFVFSFFAFLVYTGYFQVTPDEMFIKRVYKSSGVTLLITLILMTGLFVGYLLTENVNFFTNGFWISFTVMIVSFPLAFTFFQLREE